MADKNCVKCGGTGIVKEEGSIHTCFDCLKKGELDQHSKNVKESDIKI